MRCVFFNVYIGLFSIAFKHRTTAECGSTLTKEDKKKKYGEATLALHRKIKETIDQLSKSSDVPCILVSSVEKEVKKDPRTVKFHLRLLEEGEYGKLSKNGKLFCPKKSKEKEGT